MKYVCLRETVSPLFTGGTIAVCHNYREFSKIDISVGEDTISVDSSQVLVLGETKLEAETEWTNIKLCYYPVLEQSSLIAIFLKNGKPDKAVPVTGVEIVDLKNVLENTEPWSWPSFAGFVEDFAKEENKPIIYLWEAESGKYEFKIENTEAGLPDISEIDEKPLGLLTELYLLSIEIGKEDKS